ncbi:MAG: tetratricopeptide repeat protein [Lentisphaeria bacterium]|nr:tetratricopeptide repeat protein [Lentisphaeria bacterium]
MQLGPCTACEKRRGKRACPALGGESICPECCVSRRGAVCGDCEHYIAAMRLAVDRYRTTDKHPFSINTIHEDDINDVLQELADVDDTEEAEVALKPYADDTSPYYLYARGVISSKNLDDEEAMQFFLDAIWQFPFFAYAWYNLSSALLEQDYLAFAYDACHIVMNLRPPNHHLHIKAKDRLLELTEMFEDSGALFPLKEAMIRMQALIHYEKMIYTDPQRAADAFLKMQADEPENAQYPGNLGLCYAYLGRKDDAIRELRTALKLDPDDAIARANLKAVEKSNQNAEITELTPVPVYDYRSELINRHPDKPQHSEAIRMLFALYCPAPPAN